MDSDRERAGVSPGQIAASPTILRQGGFDVRCACGVSLPG